VNPRERPSGAAKRVKNNLVALGTAAMLTVYASGYLRTRSAAARFTAEAAQRMPTVAPAGDVGPQASMTPTPKSSPTAAPALHIVSEPVRATNSIPALTVAATATSSATAATAATTTPAATPSSGSSSTAVPPPTADSAAQPANKEQAPLKDGTYSGWGTSRHGDIQASVEIKDGRIISASISQCLTRYSCSWISMLPPQVVTRQSPETDYVSGATQSTNAFYYAVVEALSKAK
jgi:uncharacterized protein with FMN-binding domain